MPVCRQGGIDPKLVADQLGHGLGVNLDVYTVAGLDQRQHAVQTLEATIVRPEDQRPDEKQIRPPSSQDERHDGLRWTSKQPSSCSAKRFRPPRERKPSDSK